MIISHRHRFIFLKTRKTAGTSLEIALSAHCGPDDIITPITPEDESLRAELGYAGPRNCEIGHGDQGPNGTRFFNHIAAADVRRAVGREVWDGYFKFTVERNPFDKAVSRYWWSTRNEDPRPALEEFFAELPEKLISDWPIYTIGDEIVVDHVARHEQLTDELDRLSNQLGCDISLPSKRAKGGYRQDRRHYSQSLPPVVRTRIERVCSREIASFGYRWQAAEQ